MTTKFPKDLTDGQKTYWMCFIFMDYKRGGLDVGGQLIPSSGDSIGLPMPDKINDHPTVNWQHDNLWDPVTVASQFGGLLGGAGKLGSIATALGINAETVSYFEGQIINPFLVMLFKSPEFKQFQFSWTLAPRTQQETEDLQTILQTFRKSMMPSGGLNSGQLGGIFSGTNLNATLKYPKIVQPRFIPDDKLFQFKPCAINSVNFDYNPAGNPAFFKNTKGPVSVKLTVNMTEIEYWLSDDIK